MLHTRRYAIYSDQKHDSPHILLTAIACIAGGIRCAREANARQSFGGRAPLHSPHGFAPRKHSFALRKNYPIGYAVTCDQAFFSLFFSEQKSKIDRQITG